MRKNNYPFDFAVIGGGFAGTATVIRLLQECDTAIRIAWFEKSGEFGPGLAYATQDPSHLLNVPAGKMSLFPEKPRDFLDWVTNMRPDTNAQTFVERYWFGCYLQSRLLKARESTRATLKTFSDEVIDLVPGGSLSTVRGIVHAIECKQTLICVGNFSVDPLLDQRLGEKNYIENFYSDPTWNGLDASESVLILGTGLSMVDAVLTLKRRKHRGRIVAVSPSGRLPKTHATYASPVEIPSYLLKRGSLLQLFQWVRNQSKTRSWTDVIDAFRPHTTGIWSRLSPEDKGRFLRHLRPLWNIHRHRIPASSHKRLKELQDSGQLSIIKARIKQAVPSEDCVSVTLQTTDGQEKLTSDRILNCAGQEGNPRKIKSRLLQALLRRKIVQVDQFQFGFVTDSAGFCIDPKGKKTPIVVLGALRRGMIWESTAVAELREQVRTISERAINKNGTGERCLSPIGPCESQVNFT